MPHEHWKRKDRVTESSLCRTHKAKLNMAILGQLAAFGQSACACTIWMGHVKRIWASKSEPTEECVHLQSLEVCTSHTCIQWNPSIVATIGE